MRSATTPSAACDPATAPPRRWAWITGVVLCAAAAGSGCRRAQTTSPPPNLVLIVVDTLRADRLGSYGNQRGLTPFLDSLAARGTRFASAYALTSWTCPSIATLFTSRYPSQHGVVNFGSHLPDDEVTVAEALARQGYDARGLSANLHIGSNHGYGQGFAAFRTYLGPGKGKGVKSRADQLDADALAWLAERQAAGDGRPFLLYFQYMEPHVPYEPPEPFRSRFLRGAGEPATVSRKQLSMRYAAISGPEAELLESLYDAEVASLDAGLAGLFAGLERAGLLPNTVAVVTADHGEEFREHGLFGHGNTLFEESIRVPLIVVGPGVAAGRTVGEPVRLLDVAPSLLELAGAPAEPRFEGRSLVPLLAARTWRHPLAWLRSAWSGDGAAPDVYCELPEYDSAIDLRRHSEALIRPPMKLLVTRVPPPLARALPAGVEPGPAGPLSYDLAADPRELDPHPVSESAQGRALQQALSAIGSAVAAGASPAPREALDAATKEKMRALGYDVRE